MQNSRPAERKGWQGAWAAWRAVEWAVLHARRGSGRPLWASMHSLGGLEALFAQGNEGLLDRGMWSRAHP